MIRRQDIEIMAPVGCMESLHAAIGAGADAIYFGVGVLNMRAKSAVNFTLDDLAVAGDIGNEQDIATQGAGLLHMGIQLRNIKNVNLAIAGDVTLEDRNLIAVLLPQDPEGLARITQGAELGPCPLFVPGCQGVGHFQVGIGVIIIAGQQPHIVRILLLHQRQVPGHTFFHL